jgi:hypothetical protein
MEIPGILRTIKEQFVNKPRVDEVDRMTKKFEDTGRKFANGHNMLALLGLDEGYSRYIDLLCAERHLFYAIDFYDEKILEQARKRGISASPEKVFSKERFKFNSLNIAKRVCSAKIDGEKKNAATKGLDQRAIPPIQNAINVFFVRLEQRDRATGKKLKMDKDEISLWANRHRQLIDEATNQPSSKP